MKSFVPDREQELVLGLVVGRLGDDEFLEAFPGAPHIRAVEWLERAAREHDPLGVELALDLGHRFGFVEECLPHLLTLATADWHQRHEDVVDALSKFRSPESVDRLYELATMDFPYRNYDEFSSLGVRCVRALRHIGTLKAVYRLAELTRSDDAIVAEKASAVLRQMAVESDSQEIRDVARIART